MALVNIRLRLLSWMKYLDAIQRVVGWENTYFGVIVRVIWTKLSTALKALYSVCRRGLCI